MEENSSTPSGNPAWSPLILDQAVGVDGLALVHDAVHRISLPAP